MNDGLHSLMPFQPASGTSAPAGWKLWAGASRKGSQLLLRYELTGAAVEGGLSLGLPLEQPGSQEPPRRLDNLWQHTCFEAFLAIPEQKPYWEVNLAPRGDWNTYRLDDYRTNLHPEPGISAPQLHCRCSAGAFALQAELCLPAPLATAPVLALNLCAVLEHQGGKLSYWALGHPGMEADFHRRDGFSLRLGAPPPGR